MGKRVLLIHSSHDGQTAGIATRIGRVLAQAGHVPVVLGADDPSVVADIGDSDAVVIGAGIRYGSHGAAIERLVAHNIAALCSRPTAFFSVSLSAGGPGARPAEAARYVHEFLDRTRWQPMASATFGGALRYTRYNPFIKFMMRLIVGHAGGDTDTTHDYEYTDWKAVDRFGAEIAECMGEAIAA